MLIQDTPTAVPRSDATNAYDLLEDVIACIEQEPKRLDMREWLVTDMPRNRAYPQCGTIGCVAGWTVALSTGSDNKSFYSWEQSAREILLGPAPEQTGYNAYADRRQELFDLFYTVDVFDEGKLEFLNPGSSEYVSAIIAKIRTFMAHHADALRARALPRTEAP